MGAPKPYKDHLGNEFKSITDMCKHWKISTSVFNRRLQNGMSIEQALTALKRTHDCKDHLGNVFPNQDAMCEHYNITSSAFRHRRKHGWTIEKALTTPLRDYICTDHLGQEFKTLTKMCEHWGIDRSTFIMRTRAGIAIEQALTTPTGNEEKPKDVYGNEFRTNEEMCDAYQIPVNLFSDRIRNKKSKIEALDIIPILSQHLKDYEYDENLTILEAIRHNEKTSSYTPKYFVCILDGHEIMLTRQRILDYCMEHLPEDKNPMKKL